MNLPAPLHIHRVGHASSDPLGRPDPKLRIDPAESDDFRNPLWMVAIGTGCLLAAMAAVIALG